MCPEATVSCWSRVSLPVYISLLLKFWPLAMKWRFSPQPPNAASIPTQRLRDPCTYSKKYLVIYVIIYWISMVIYEKQLLQVGMKWNCAPHKLVWIPQVSGIPLGECTAFVHKKFHHSLFRWCRWKHKRIVHAPQSPSRRSDGRRGHSIAFAESRDATRCISVWDDHSHWSCIHGHLPCSFLDVNLSVSLTAACNMTDMGIWPLPSVQSVIRCISLLAKVHFISNKRFMQQNPSIGSLLFISHRTY